MAKTSSGGKGNFRYATAGSRVSGDATARHRVFQFRLRYAIVAVVLVWAGYHYLTTQLPQYNALKSQEVSLTKQLQGLQTQHKLLQTQQAQLGDKSYVLQYAAKKYNLIEPGQVAFNLSH
ncbi:septum formation initiator family protein [Alicyclobacillus ferrooxydans]|uniref:Septum formation initiator n=1 Tax=Alicyclobacillus ferrooxydans TaxID=471514 RepID=A0A0P9D5D3_9BACL|nr:septum formation initiator family protein [Alicyclobacillus ferrooxydans]KPV44656.1 hypothetical protein AN477_06715 [Alicyclobacillus ferrooxydans]